MKSLYSTEDIEVMKQAADSLDRSLDRIEEIVAYGKYSGIKIIGIANCASVMKEADVLEGMLTDQGFEVKKVHCKYGKMPMDDLLDNYKGTACNPAGQAQYLRENNTELNIAMGLCVGHDMIFNKKSSAPVTTLLVKDRKLSHNTVSKLKHN